MSFVRFSSVVTLIVFIFFPTPVVSQDMSMPGDINGDGLTNHIDFFLYALTFDPHGHRASSPAEDLNQDFEIDHNDLYLAILGRLHGEHGLPPIDLNRTGTIEGRVLEDVGDAAVVIPVPGANVYILASTGHRFRIQTNDGGGFRADGIPEGPATLRVEHPNYNPGYGRVEIQVGQIAETTILIMPRRDDLASLRGVVQGAANPFVDFQQPLGGAVVRVMPIDQGQVIGDNNPDHLPGEVDPDQVVFTNDRGFYEVHDLPPGEYRMVVSADGYESDRRDIRIEGNEPQVQDFLLFEITQEGGALFGTVTSMGEPAQDMKGIEPGSDHPIAGAHILMEPEWWDETIPVDENGAPSDQPIIFPHPVYETRTNNEGHYKIESVLPGRYRVHVWAEGHFPENATVEIVAENETEKDFVLTPIVIEYGAVAGTVFGVTPEDSAQVPLADALVSLVPRFDFEFPPALATIYPDQPAAFVQSATTDDEGHYQFNHVPVGLYDLFASARGWGRTSAPAEVIKDETAEVDLVIVHTPPPGPSTLEGTVWLQPEGAETVLEPASGAEVIAIPAEPEWFEVDPNGTDPTIPLPPPHLVTRTDEQGHYRFDPIRPGKYHVIASFRGYRSSEELVGIPPESVVTQDFVLSPILTGPGKVLGRVTFSPPMMMASEPQPIAGAKVLLISRNDFPIPLPILEPDQLNGLPILPPDLLYETRTNERGYFEFPEVQPGHYLIQVSAEDFQSERRDIWVPAGETVTLHFDLIPGMGGSEDAVLEGGVFDSRFVDGSDNYRDPIVGATVVAIPLCLNCDPAIGNIGPDGQILPPRITQTNERGRYRFEGMSAGAVAVTVIAEGYLPAIQYTHLPSGQTTVVNFYLEKIGGSDPTGLYGKVTQWTPYPTFAPVPVPGAHIYLEPLFPLPLPPTGPIPYVLDTVTDDQGNYRFPNLEPGPYLVDIKAEGFTSIEDMEVNVPNGQKTRQDFLLYPLNQGSASYLGHVFHVEGDVPPDAKLVLHPIPGATVRLVPDWLPVIEIFPPPNVGFDRTTNEEGEFYFEDLVAGGYSVTVIKEGYAIQSGHIQLEETEVLNQDWFLDPDADNLVHVRGRVQEDTGELDIFIPIEGATLLLKDANSGIPSVAETQSGPGGDFEFPPVEPGGYQLVVEAVGYERHEQGLSLGQEKEPFVLVELQPQMEPVNAK